MNQISPVSISVTESDRIARDKAVGRAERAEQLRLNKHIDQEKLQQGSDQADSFMSPSETRSFYGSMEPGEATVREEEFLRNNPHIRINEEWIESLRKPAQRSEKEGPDFRTPVPFPKDPLDGLRPFRSGL